MNDRSVLITGIDGGTWSVLRPALSGGYMPRLSGLVETGASGVLESTVPAITPAAWSSFQTGANPGRTGIFDFSRWDGSTGNQLMADVRQLPETVWEAAGSAGRRVGVLNLPMTYPPRPVNGFLVSGLMTPSVESVFTYPESLRTELLDRFPGYHIFNLETAVEEASRESLDAFLEWISSIAVSRADSACWLLHREPVDLFMVHFQAPDVLQHVLWAYLDPDHPRFDAGKNRTILDTFYRTLDAAVGRVVDTFASLSAVIPLTLVISDHGFQTHLKRFNLWRWLREEGYLVLDVAAGTGIDPESLETEAPPVDLEGSRAFSSGRSNEAFIYLLETGGDARRRTGEGIVEGLISLRDPDSGERVIEAVHKREDLYEGDRTGMLPDLVVVPEGPFSVTGRYEPDAPLFRSVMAGEDFHIGRHHRDGIFIAAGPGVVPHSELRLQLIDIAPTVLSYLAIEPPESMDGNIANELFAEGFVEPHAGGRVAERESAPEEELSGDVYSEKERELIEKRLRDLGYL